MQYGDFTLPLRPETLQVEFRREIKETAPDGETVSEASVQDLGALARVVTGEGVFTGSGAAQSFSSLAAKMNGAQLLIIPGVGQWQAYLSELTYLGEPGYEAVGYAFRFVEALS